MSTTQTNSITHIVHSGTEVIGKVTLVGKTYRAARRNGTATDARRVSQGFRTVEAAAAWIGAK